MSLATWRQTINWNQGCELARLANDADGFLGQTGGRRNELVGITIRKRAADDALVEALKKIHADPTRATLPFLLRNYSTAAAQQKCAKCLRMYLR